MVQGVFQIRKKEIWEETWSPVWNVIFSQNKNTSAAFLSRLESHLYLCSADAASTARGNATEGQTGLNRWLGLILSYIGTACNGLSSALLTSTLTVYLTPYATLVHQGGGTEYPR